MDTTIIFALTLSALFFGCIIWLIIYARRQERQAGTLKQPEAKTPDAKTKKRVA